jgi:ParB-like chromosome segregation protein Spo0J
VIVLKIEYVATDDLIPYINNSRTHSESQIKQIAASIREFGFTNPILIDEAGTIIAGHGRVMAAQVLELDEVPTITLDGLSDAQRKAYVIADNKLALNAGWDTEILLAEIDALQDLNFDTQLLGFSADELSEMLNIEESQPKEETYSEIFNIIVECDDEMEQEKIFNQLESEGYKCRVQSL